MGQKKELIILLNKATIERNHVRKELVILSRAILKYCNKPADGAATKYLAETVAPMADQFNKKYSPKKQKK